MEQTLEAPVNIDATTYETFKGMLTSTDRGNAVVALSILEQADMKKCFPYILMLIKEQVVFTTEEFAENAPKLHARLQALDIRVSSSSKSSVDMTQLTYKRIFDIIKDQCDPEAIQFVIDKFATTLNGMLQEWGVDLVKELDLKMTIK